MIWDEFLRHFRFCDEEDSGLSDEEQERKGPKNRPKHTRKRIHQAKKNFLKKFKTASNYVADFMNGVLTREQFWVLAKFKYPTHQISFCTSDALKCITYKGHEEVKE